MGLLYIRRVVRSKTKRRRLLSVPVIVAGIILFLLWMRRRSENKIQSRLFALMNGKEPRYVGNASTISELSNRVVIVTAVNYAFRAHLANLRCSLKRLHLETPLKVVALDNKVATWALENGFDIVHNSEENAFISTEDVRFGSEQFNLLSKRKIVAVREEIAGGKDVLFTDADMFWCGNAVADVIREADINGDDLLMQSAWPRSLLNSGFYYARSNSRTLEVLDELLRHRGSKENDQVLFNRFLCNPKFGGRRRNSRDDFRVRRRFRNPLGCARGSTNVSVLNRWRYPTGGETINGEKMFKLSRGTLTAMCERKQFMIIHNNCIFSEKKTARFVVKGFWYVADDEVSCMDKPAEVTQQALKKCGTYKCGRLDRIKYWAERKRKQEAVKAFWAAKRNLKQFA